MNVINSDYNKKTCYFSLNGICASSQPLASDVGLDILKKGGNAADAAIAMAATLNVTQPCSTGIGGDCFLLYYNSKTKEIKGINASGRAPSKLNIELCKSKGYTDSIPKLCPLSVNVPGAVAGWCDTIEKFGSGKLSLSEILKPAIEYAEQGVPIQPKTSYMWEFYSHALKSSPNGNELLINGELPKAGQIFKNPNLANVLKRVGEFGKKGFYEGPVAESIVKILIELGGVMTLEDLSTHTSTFDEPISIKYRGYDIFEMPPNGQGLVTLLALNILEGFELKNLNPFSPEYLHLLIEALRLSFHDTNYHVSDPLFSKIPIKELLSKEYAEVRRLLISKDQRNHSITRGNPESSSSTVYLSVVDGDGNACSFINSNYHGFGTGIVPKGLGFTLQNRACDFSLDHNHPNSLKPGKRSYHTIIPGMILKDGNLFASFGNMGSYMQPQAHVQLICNLIDHKMDPQSALDHPRFCILDVKDNDGKIAFEEGHSQESVDALATRFGQFVHRDLLTSYKRHVFGNGQIIVRDSQTNVLCGGTDNRCDGQISLY
eukprot:gene6615-8186_t